jgi:nucleoside-diphosphate-sugar epimerase
MKVLITGGTGFIGSRLALRYLGGGDSVGTLGQVNTEAEVSNKNQIERAGAEVVLAPVTDKARVSEAMRGVDVVYHLAAAQHEANVPDQHFYDVNVTGTQNVLDAALDAGVKRFVHGSTIGVYGSAMEGTLDESSPVKPDNIYGVTKLEGEKLALSYVGRLPVSVIRISESYGPGDRRLLRLFKAIGKQRFFMIGKGDNLHHPIFIDDLIDGMILAAAVDEAVGHIFVLPGKEVVTTNEMVGTIASALGTRFPMVRAPMFPFMLAANVAVNTMGRAGIQPPIHPRRMDFFRKSFIFREGEAARVIGFAPKHSFREGVKKTAQWYAEMGYL